MQTSETTHANKNIYYPPVGINLVKNLLLGVLCLEILRNIVLASYKLWLVNTLSKGTPTKEVLQNIKALGAQIDMWVNNPYLVLWFLSIGLLITWTYKMNKFCWSQGVKSMEITPIMSIVWWFIPLANLIAVPKILMELSRALTLKENWKDLPSFKLIIPWWLTFIGLRIYMTIVDVRSEELSQNPNPEGYISLMNFSTGLNILTILSMVLLIWVVVKLNSIKLEAGRFIMGDYKPITENSESKDCISFKLNSNKSQEELCQIFKTRFPDFSWRKGDSDAIGHYLVGRNNNDVVLRVYLDEKPVVQGLIIFDIAWENNPNREEKKKNSLKEILGELEKIRDGLTKSPLIIV